MLPSAYVHQESWESAMSSLKDMGSNEEWITGLNHLAVTTMLEDTTDGHS